MNKFKQPVAMQVTEEQFEKDLKKPLLKLGWNDKIEWNTTYNPTNSCNYLYLDTDTGEWGFHNHECKPNRFIETYNPKLFLAIAAMTEGDVPIVGEWMIMVKSSSRSKKGYIFEVKKVATHGDSSQGFVSISHPTGLGKFRKATLEELINHFNKEEMSEKENRFPFTLTKHDADKLLDAACVDWRNILAEAWGAELLLNNEVEVTEDYYNKIRKACNQNQHKVMDEVFGKDKKEATINDFRDAVEKFLFDNGMDNNTTTRGYVCVSNMNLSLNFSCSNEQYTKAIAGLLLITSQSKCFYASFGLGRSIELRILSGGYTPQQCIDSLSQARGKIKC